MTITGQPGNGALEPTSHQYRLCEHLTSICFQPFGESDVRQLLVELRPELSSIGSPFLLLADGIAHSQGLDRVTEVTVIGLKWHLWWYGYHNKLESVLNQLSNAKYDGIRRLIKQVDDPTWRARTGRGRDEALQEFDKCFHRRGACVELRTSRRERVLPIVEAALGKLEVRTVTQATLLDDIERGLNQAGVDAAWAKLIRLVGDEVGVATVSAASALPLRAFEDIEARLELGESEGNLALLAHVEGPPGSAELAFAFLRTASTVKDRVFGGSIARAGLGRARPVKYVAQRAKDGRLVLIERYRSWVHSSMAVEAVEQELALAEPNEDPRSVRDRVLGKFRDHGYEI